MLVRLVWRSGKVSLIWLLLVLYLCFLSLSISDAIKPPTKNIASNRQLSSIFPFSKFSCGVKQWFQRPNVLQRLVVSQPSNTRTFAQSDLQAADQKEPPSSLTSINFLMVLFYGTLGAVMPFLPVFYKSLGVSNSLIGVLGAITPAVTFLVSPLWGALADMTGWHKEIMLLTFVGSIIARSALVAGNNNIIWLSIIVALSAVLNAPVKPLLDSAIMSMLTDKSAYGKSRLFGQIGMGAGSFITGLLQSNYQIMFLAQALFALPTAYLMSLFQPKKQVLQKESGENLLKALRKTINLKVVIFFAVVFVIGISSGIIENFAYVRLSQIEGSTTQVLGFMRLASSLAGGPMFWISGDIIKSIGVKGVLNMSLLSYILRFTIYASVNHAWLAMPAEILRGFSFAMFWAGATYYVYGIAPTGLTATMLGFLNGVYGGLGQSLGSLIGGEMSRRYGIGKTFLYAALVDSALLLLFLLYQNLTIEHPIAPISPPPAPTEVKVVAASMDSDSGTCNSSSSSLSDGGSDHSVSGSSAEVNNEEEKDVEVR